MLTVACVWTGNKYGWEYVERLRNMVARYLPPPFRFVCITDKQPIQCINFPDEPIEYLPARPDLPGWWAKMQYFDRALMGDDKLIALDLDTVIVDDLTPLANIPHEFGICENFTRLAGHKDWPCKYGSCAMVLAAGFGQKIWDDFAASPYQYMNACPRGDQQVIERIKPNATFLQPVLPFGYFLGYRDLTPTKPEGCAVVVFAGNSKPHNCEHQWIKDAWK